MKDSLIKTDIHNKNLNLFLPLIKNTLTNNGDDLFRNKQINTEKGMNIFNQPNLDNKNRRPSRCVVSSKELEEKKMKRKKNLFILLY